MTDAVFADDRGVWLRTESGRSFGIPWDEIAAVSGSKLDGITEVYTCIYLDFEYGEFIELNDTMPGFSAAVVEIGRRIDGMPDDWFERIEQRTPQDDVLEVWARR